MGTLLNRRRYMGGGGGYPADAIMTIETNPEVLAICYAQGWCANDKYMTASEAAAVTSIGTVFYNNKNIKHFEEFEYFTSVTSIANNGIRNCTNLKTLVIPINVTSIGNDALRNNGIESLYVNCNNTSWGNAYTFADNQIKYLYSNSKNTTPSGTFSKLETLVLSQNVETLGGFRNAVLLENITMPESLTTINANCFRGCSKLITLNVPSGVTSIGSDAFRASGIKSIYIYGNISSWGTNAFAEMTLEYMYSNSQYTEPKAPASLIRLDLGSNVRGVGGFGSTSVSIVNIQEGAETFYDNCFKNCSSLQSIVLPSTTSVMRDGVFHTCASLTSVTILATTPPTGVSQYTFMDTPNAIVYVPSGSVDAYKAASGWSQYASRIQAIPT